MLGAGSQQDPRKDARVHQRLVESGHEFQRRLAVKNSAVYLLPKRNRWRLHRTTRRSSDVVDGYARSGRLRYDRCGETIRERHPHVCMRMHMCAYAYASMPMSTSISCMRMCGTCTVAHACWGHAHMTKWRRLMAMRTFTLKYVPTENLEISYLLALDKTF